MPSAFVVLVLLFAVGLGCLLSACARSSSGGEDGKTPVTRQSVRSLSREQVLEKLKTLEARKAPEPKMGAMCYDMAAPPNRAEYVCPKCHEKTLYTNDVAWAINRELDDCRREFSLLKAASELSLTLDESSFCAHCSPSATKHEIALIVTYADGSPHTTTGVASGELRMLREFLKGKLTFATENEGTEPLKPHLSRLRQLLGIEADKKDGEGATR